MKTIISKVFLSVIILTLILVSCEEVMVQDSTENIIPEKFTVDIPQTLIKRAVNGRVNGRLEDGDLDGGKIYEALGVFIHIAENAGDFIEFMMSIIYQMGINQPISITYMSDDDHRNKNLEVIENATFEGIQYEYKLTITDVDAEAGNDGIGLQIFWSRNPVKGVAILNPYNINHTDDFESIDAILRIDYSEGEELGYDAHMFVSIANLTLPDSLVDPYGMDNLKMFVGKEADYIDVYGNSNHPNASFFTDDAGFSWSFVASGLESVDIGVAEVGLPPNNLDETSRTVLLEDYSIKNVFTNQILNVWPNADQSIIDELLVNTEAPGFFGNAGFIQGGESPGMEYDPLVERIQLLTPFNPNNIRNLEILFDN